MSLSIFAENTAGLCKDGTTEAWEVGGSDVLSTVESNTALPDSALLLFRRDNPQKNLALSCMKTYDIKILAEPFRDSIKPRERAEEQGIHSLSDRELIALLLGTGTGGKDVMALALEVLNFIESQNFLFTKEEISKIKGMGSARSTQMMAVFEIVRRHSSGNGMKITNPETVYKILFHYTDRPKEFFFALTLNGAHELIKRHIISTGNLNRVYVHPREVFTEVIRDRAAAIIIAHNHPSGSLEPSMEDKQMTKSLKRAAELLKIPLLDHVIFSREGFYSFLESGVL